LRSKYRSDCQSAGCYILHNETTLMTTPVLFFIYSSNSKSSLKSGETEDNIKLYLSQVKESVCGQLLTKMHHLLSSGLNMLNGWCSSSRPVLVCNGHQLHVGTGHVHLQTSARVDRERNRYSHVSSEVRRHLKRRSVSNQRCAWFLMKYVNTKTFGTLKKGMKLYRKHLFCQSPVAETNSHSATCQTSYSETVFFLPFNTMKYVKE